MNNGQISIGVIVAIGFLGGILISDLVNVDLANQRGSDWAIYKTELCKELGGSPNKEGGYCNIWSRQILYGQLNGKEFYIQGLKQGIFLGAKFEECNIEEQIKGVISNPTEYCYDKIIGKEV